ncbi:MAG: hypothetical protein ACRDEA_06755 [Microcystaceae cyanobacterium]
MPTQKQPAQLLSHNRRRAIAYSMDALIPGLYLWVGTFVIQIGGSQPEENYPGTVHSFAGGALVLPGYRIYSTDQGDYDP